MLQTDNTRAVNAWREGRDVTKLGIKSSSIHVQAENCIDDQRCTTTRISAMSAAPMRSAVPSVPWALAIWTALSLFSAYATASGSPLL